MTAVELLAEKLQEEIKYGASISDIIDTLTKWQQEQILDFLYKEITERRDYSASKMCEVVIDYIKQNK